MTLYCFMILSGFVALAIGIEGASDCVAPAEAIEAQPHAGDIDKWVSVQAVVLLQTKGSLQKTDSVGELYATDTKDKTRDDAAVANFADAKEKKTSKTDSKDDAAVANDAEALKKELDASKELIKELTKELKDNDKKKDRQSKKDGNGDASVAEAPEDLVSAVHKERGPPVPQEPLPHSWWTQDMLLHALRQRVNSALVLVGNSSDALGTAVLVGNSSLALGNETSSQPQPTMAQVFMFTIMTGIQRLFWICVTAFIYLKIKEHLLVAPEEEEQKDTQSFDYTLFDFPRNFNAYLCCTAFVCCPIRWSDTVSHEKLKLTTFWQALLTCSCLWVFRNVPFIGFILFLILIRVAVYYRQSIRAHYGLERGTFMSLAEDCISYTFCAPCAILQEARQVTMVTAKAKKYEPAFQP